MFWGSNMTVEQFAITESGYRAITTTMQLSPGETRVSEIPAALLLKVRGDQMKAERSQRLRGTDWTQMPDAPLTAAEKLAMSIYRQALRDLPGVAGFPDVPWPVVPNITTGAAGAGNGQPVPIG